ncbi:DUF4905 domain-containing protein [Tunicatimonas pelagia]|uniref:DUF4905 domain-containing protein n=1 Tax=Tunicatimonas pelagia TaxID=931531 RepID=UPI002665B9E5|nr:DUF4905 domain-containing protein [Tunicatimonas pelagia]WKN45739.1 DUF4905 domain-containing protein [Tunicatimonas pelagia]
MLKKLTPNFSFTFKAPVWKTIVDDEGKHLFLELRSAEGQSTYFAALDLSSGQLLWEDFTLSVAEGWPTLYRANDQYLVFQVFTDTHNPEKKAYYAVEISTQQLIQPQTQPSVRNLINGETNQKNTDRQNNGLVQPFFYAEDQPYFATVASFVGSLGLGQPVKGCEYADYGNYIGIAYYLPAESSGLANYLLILDQQGTILLHECLEASVPQVGLGTFFIAQNQLIVVQHQRQLVSYALS